MTDFEETAKVEEAENTVDTTETKTTETSVADIEETPIVEETIGVRIEEPKVMEVKAVEEAKKSEAAEVKTDKKRDKKKKDKKTEAEVVEVANIPSEVVSAKDSKKYKKATSFMAFAVIVLTLLFSIIDWTVSSVTRDPQIMLHLMDWIVILLYLLIAVKAISFIKGKKKWVKVLYVICVIATIICIVVPMIMDYVDLSKAIKAEQQAKNIIAMFI